LTNDYGGDTQTAAVVAMEKNDIVDTKTTAAAKILVIKTTEAVNMESTTRKDNTTMAGKQIKNAMHNSFTVKLKFTLNGA
jgi:hypothetical protein